MATLNSNLKELSKKIRLKKTDIKKRCDSVTKFIRKKLNKKFESRTIGSYAIKTTVKQEDRKYDIDMALILHNLDEKILKNQKQCVYDILRLYKEKIKDDPVVKYKEYAVTLDFESSTSGNKYHFDYTIYNENHFVVKGKQHINKELEKSGNISFVEIIKTELENDSREHFHIVTRLLKHCVKNGKFNRSLTLPSIVITSLTKDFIDSNWFGSDDFLESVINVFESIKSKINDYKLPFEPYDNPFTQFSNQEITVTKNKIKEIIDTLKIANSETNDIKKWNLIVDLFPGLEKPDKGSGDGEKSAIQRTTRSQGA